MTMEAPVARPSAAAPPRFAGPSALRIAVLVPCFNEDLTIASTVRGFRDAIPECRVYVYDNNSTDASVERALAAGAEVRTERRQGKGHVVRRMFADIDADLYILVDGDDTYDASAAPAAVARLLSERLDFLNIARSLQRPDAFRPGHRLGNRVLTEIVRSIFGRQCSDMLSGYKLFSRRFIKSFPAMSRGFEIETELTVHALELRMPMGESEAPHRDRPQGSASKLRTVQDGIRILWLISRLIKDERPLPVFGGLGLGLVVLGIVLGLPVVATFFETGLVPRLPTAVLSVGLVMLGWLAVFAGIIIDILAKMRREMKMIAYLAIPPTRSDP